MVELIAIDPEQYKLIQQDSMNYIRVQFDNCNKWELTHWINEAIKRGLPEEFIEEMEKDSQL